MLKKDIFHSDWPSYENRYYYHSREHLLFFYPEVWMTMQWMSLFCKEAGLYLSSYDNENFSTGFVFEHERANMPMTAGIIKSPFVRRGEKWRSPANVVSFHAGDWHVGADKYRGWCASWMKPRHIPRWIENLDGWLSVQGHAGDMHILYRYDDYPGLAKSAMKLGLGALHLHCGVHEEGIEGGYPYWNNYSKTMGGKRKLLEAIRRIHRNGGRVITFTKDNKVNIGCRDFKSRFSQYQIVTRDGAGLRSAYPVGTLDSFKASQQLACMCRACRQWADFTWMR
jgi:hypothetical protein